MKIIHLGHVPPPSDHPQRARMGAIHPGRWVLNHAIAQKRAGMDVEVVAQAHKATCDFVCEIEGVKVHFLRTYHPYRHFTFYAIDQFRMASYVKKLRPDIVHAHGTEAAYALAAIRTGLPFCVTAQGLMFQIIPTLGHKPGWNMRFIRMSEHYAWKRTKYAIAKSEYGLEALRSRYPHLDLTLIHNTYEKDLDSPLREKRSHSLAYVGSFDKRKGVHLIAAAMEAVSVQFPDVKLHMMGNPDEATASGYAGEQIRRLRRALGERLHLHGVISSKEVFSILDGCVAILAPSIEEMSGNQVTEGIMRGCHAIVTEGTGAAGIAYKIGNSSFFPVEDAVAFSAAISAVLEAPPDQVVIEEAREKMRLLMSPTAVASKHDALYQRICFG